MDASNHWWRQWQAHLTVVLVANVLAFLYYIHFSMLNGYLPSPFFYDKSDTFMDLFNALHWAYDDRRYTDWSSVYPPLNFIFLRFLDFVFAGAGYGAPEFMREQSSSLIGGLCLMYLTIPALVLKTNLWLGFSKIEKILLYFAIILSPPMLFALERGNMILLAPILLAIALSNTGVRRGASIAILINLKAYLALLLIYYVARRNWKDLAICVVMSGSIFLISGFILDKHFFLFFPNLLNFSHGDGMFSLREMMAMPSSISAFSYVLKSPAAVALASEQVNPTVIPIVVSIIEISKWVSLAIPLVVLFIKAPVMRDAEIFALLVVLISNMGVWVGGYTLIFYIVLIPVFISLHGRWLSIGILILLALPFDLVPLMQESIGIQYSYFSDSYTSVNWTLGLGSVIRPIVNLLLLWLLSCEFIARKPTATIKNIAHKGKLGRTE